MAKTNIWMAVSDLMTGLMVVFLFVSIAYLYQIQQQDEKKKHDFSEYVDTKTKLQEKFKEKFEDKKDELTILSENNDVTLRFSKAETLFPRNESRLTPHFEKILDEVIPDYMDVLLESDLSKHIREIRIEGHTDDSPFGPTDADPYLSNLKLSQDRSREVVKYIRKVCMGHYMYMDYEKIEAWLTAVGYSYTFALDKNGEYISKSKERIDSDKSRRVEIRIITDDYKVLEEIIKR